METIVPPAEGTAAPVEGTTNTAPVEGAAQSTTPAEGVAQNVAPTEGAPVQPTLTFGENIHPDIQEFAKANKFSQEQFDGTFKFFGEYLNKKQSLEAMDMFEKGKAHIASWGDDAQYNLSLAKQALKATDPEGKLAARLKTTGAANDPVVLDFLASLGRMMQEGGFIKSSALPSPGKKSLAEKMFGGTQAAAN